MIGWNLTFLHLHFGHVFCKSLHSAFLGAGFGAGRRCFFKLARNSSISVFYEIKKILDINRRRIKWHASSCWSLSLYYYLMQNSDHITIEKTHPTLFEERRDFIFYLLTEEELEAINLLVSYKECIHKCISSVRRDRFLIFQETCNLESLLGHMLDLKAKLLFLHSRKTDKSKKSSKNQPISCILNISPVKIGHSTYPLLDDRNF